MSDVLKRNTAKDEWFSANVSATAVAADLVELRAVARMTGLILSVIALDIVISEADSEIIKLSVRQNMEDAISRNPDGYTYAEREASAILWLPLRYAIDEWAKRAQAHHQRRLERTGGARSAPSMTPEEAAANRRRLTGN